MPRHEEVQLTLDDSEPYSQPVSMPTRPKETNEDSLTIHFPKQSMPLATMASRTRRCSRTLPGGVMSATLKVNSTQTEKSTHLAHLS